MARGMTSEFQDLDGYRRVSVFKSLAVLFSYLSIVLIFAISGERLEAWGFSYISSSGPFWQKVHPGTWLAIAAIASAACSAGNPLLFLSQIMRHRGLVLLAVAWTGVLGMIVLVEKTPASPIIDTFVLPMMTFLMISEGIIRPTRQLAIGLHAFLIANAALGLFEFLSGIHLTPPIFGIYDWRSYALLGIPLTNAMMTGAYVQILLLGFGDDLPRPIRPFVIALELLAMAAFGGRTALIATLAFGAAFLLYRAVRMLRGARTTHGAAAAFFFCAPLLGLGAVVIAQMGFFDLFLGRFINDAGSAETRVLMVKVFDMMPLQQLFFGPDQAWIESLKHMEGLDLGFESFWFGFILQHGLLISIPLFIGVLAFCVDVLSYCRPQAWILFFYYFVQASSNSSMSVKTTNFALFILVVMVLMRPRKTPPAGVADAIASARAPASAHRTARAPFI